MKSVLYTVLVMAICLYTANSCKEYTDKVSRDKTTTYISDYLSKKTIISFKGQITDDDKTPLDSVTICIEDASIITDKNGNFSIKNVSIYNDFAPVELRKKGYKTIVLNRDTKDSIQTVNITLHKETESCLFWFCKHNHNLPNISD